jgi:hypothetical protein
VKEMEGRARTVQMPKWEMPGKTEEPQQSHNRQHSKISKESPSALPRHAMNLPLLACLFAVAMAHQELLGDLVLCGGAAHGLT